ncbi:dihydropteroate synthase [Halalkalibacillus halophilus]|uniref:dihydropteroate synthase n=1 Tax=Halalkalibacillus halophilus TaxID=392827 RepID=UPI0003F9D6CF|nr:dihydropteroate synthase [Halalkalibacillus halophilus]
MTRHTSHVQSLLHDSNRTIVMGIINTTPDSFSDGGKFIETDAAVRQAKKLVAEGADLLDIGGESTRPGHIPVTEEEEVARVAPVIEAILKEVDVPISIDTYKSGTAEAALTSGASVINDVWGAQKDSKIVEVAKAHDAPIILMHNEEAPNYDDLIEDMKTRLNKSVQVAKQAGLNDNQIILDPGIGFGKTHEQNLLAMRRLHELQTMKYPLLLGTSRKSIVGKALDLPVEERLEGTLATLCFGISQGVKLVRVHDVKEAKRTVTMMDQMMGKGVRSNG